MSALHRLAHALGLNRGTIRTWKEDEHWWIGFVCATCFQVSHKTHLDSCGCGR